MIDAQLPSDGVYDDRVVLGIESEIDHFSNDEENRGFKVAFHEANAAGGVAGRQIVWREHSGVASADVTSRLTAARLMVEQDRVFALVNMGGPLAIALAEYAAEVRTPYLFPHTGLIKSDRRRYVFTSFPEYADEARLMFAYLPRAQGLKRLGIVHDVNPYGAFFHAELVAGAAANGYTLAGAVAIAQRKPADLRAELASLIDAGADGVVMALYPEQARALMRAKSALGWQGRMIASGPLTDEQLLVQSDGAAEGTLGFCYYPDPERSEQSGVAAYRAAMMRYEPGRPLNRYTLYGYVFGRLIVEGLRRAGRALDRERFIDAMERIENWSSGGVMPPVSFASGQHHAQRAGFVCELRGGRFEALSDWISDLTSVAA